MGIRVIFKFFIVVLAFGLFGIAGLLFFAIKGMKEENSELLMTEEKLSYQIKTLTNERNYKREYFQRLLYDEEFAARVIRQKLGFANADEIVFRFEQSGPVKVQDPFAAKHVSNTAKQPVYPKVSPEQNGGEAAAKGGEASANGDASSVADASVQAEEKVERKTLVDYLMFWKQDEEPQKVAENKNVKTEKLDLPEINLEQPKGKVSEISDESQSRKIDEAREIETPYILETVENPRRTRIKFITSASTRTKMRPNLPPKQIYFSSSR